MKQIEMVEKKRIRSQAALVEAILTHTSPNDQDTDYFNRYTAEINVLRQRMQELEAVLASIE